MRLTSGAILGLFALARGQNGGKVPLCDTPNVVGPYLFANPVISLDGTEGGPTGVRFANNQINITRIRLRGTNQEPIILNNSWGRIVNICIAEIPYNKNSCATVKGIDTCFFRTGELKVGQNVIVYGKAN